MQTELDNTISAIKKLKQSIDEVSECYRYLDWNDNIYESYKLFDDQLKSIKEQLESESRKIRQIDENLKAVSTASEISERFEMLKQE